MTSQLSTEVFTTFWLLAPSVVSATAAQQEAFTARVAGGRFKTSLARRTDVEAGSNDTRRLRGKRVSCAM